MVGILAIIFFLKPLMSESQVNYSVPPLINYFMFYKNGKSIDILNDSIRTSFFKFNDTSFLVKFYVNGKIRNQCFCFYRGKKTNEKANILEVKNGKRTIIKKEFTVRELALKNKTCLDFLPKELLKLE